MPVKSTTGRPVVQDRSRPPRALPSDPGLQTLLADVELSAGAKLLAVAMVSRWAWSRAALWPSNETLAAAIGRSVGHTRRLLAELERRGFIRRDMTDEVPGGRRIVLVWRTVNVRAVEPLPCAPRAEPPCAPLSTERIVSVERFESERVEVESPSRPRGEVTAQIEQPPSVTDLPLIPPSVALSPVEAQRLAELADTTRERILGLLLLDDPILSAEARRALQPPRTPAPPPATLRELLERLREDPSHVPTAAAALCQAFDDHKSYSGYLARLEEVWRGEREVDDLVGAYRQASSGRARKPGAVFMHVLR